MELDVYKIINMLLHIFLLNGTRILLRHPGKTCTSPENKCCSYTVLGPYITIIRLLIDRK